MTKLKEDCRQSQWGDTPQEFRQKQQCQRDLAASGNKIIEYNQGSS